MAGQALPLNPANGAEGPALVAEIDEAACIGCAKCLPPCPVDAIVGAHKQMHTVLAALCTGCELCVAPCPVDCIRMLPRAPLAGPAPAAADNRVRYEARNARLARQARERAALLSARKGTRALSGRRDEQCGGCGAARRRAPARSGIMHAHSGGELPCPRCALPW